MQVFGLLYGLSSPFGIELYKKVGNVGLDGTFRNKKDVRDFPIGQSFGNVDQHFIFPFAYAELFHFFMVDGTTWICGWTNGFSVDIYPDEEKNKGYAGKDDLNGSIP